MASLLADVLRMQPCLQGSTANDYLYKDVTRSTEFLLLTMRAGRILCVMFAWNLY